MTADHDSPRESAALLRMLKEYPRPLVMAHRGNSVRCPENTMAAFSQAFADGADLLETDLHLSSDGEFMCIHDATLERTTNGTGEVRAKTRAELQSLSASYGRAEFDSECIPTLRELLEIVPERCGLGLELKSDDFLDEKVCKRLQDLTDTFGITERTVVMSFSTERLAAVRRSAPRFKTGLIAISKVTPPVAEEVFGVWWPFVVVNPLLVWMTHRRGQAFCPLDPAPDGRLWYYKLLDCDAVLSNDPAQTLNALGRYSG
jgi:glycerophosphoryl diester phosphodiesterase